ncbi:MAG: calcium-binding protein, partial [Hyphomonadaceae bacterium]
AEGSAPGKDPVGNDPVLEALGQGKVVRDNPNTPGADTNYLRVYGGEHVVLGGTNGNDIIIGDFGDDGIWGDAGDDRIESGAGVDLVNGGAGNDIITDSGDSFDFLKGDEGDDVIANSNGIDILMGGTGQDVVFIGVDDTEVFAGQGNDFILGGAGVDLIMGNEGDDWIEGGAGFDTTVGDNSELNFDSKIIGHDVMFAGSEENDHDGESGDDIMVDGESVIRSEGMMGFDWVIHKNVLTPANVDMGIPIFTTEQADILRDRYDKVEAASGWKFNDVLIGDDRTYDPNANLAGNVEAGAGALFFRDELDLAGRARITGLDQVITNDLMFTGTYGSDWSNDTKLIFSGGNVLLGGAGSDFMAGKAGNDIIDGDRWLNVRIRISAPGLDNQIATVDSLEHTFTTEEATAAGNPSWAGRSLFELMIDRVIVPNQLHIVREVLNGNQTGDVDTAMFWDVRANYTITRANDGTITVRHDTVGTVVPILPNTTFKAISDGTDTLRNIEVLRFGDGAGGTVDISVGQLFPFAA